MNTHETTKAPEYQEFHPGNVVEMWTDRSDSLLPTVMGQPAIAELCLGGHTSEDSPYEAEKVLVVSIVDKRAPEYREVMARAIARDDERAPKSEFALVSVSQDGVVKGVAFLPQGNRDRDTLNLCVVGRRSGDSGDVKKPSWIDFGAVDSKPNGWTPFDDNESVSRKQLVITTRPGKVMLWPIPDKPGSDRTTSRSAIRGVGVEIRNSDGKAVE